MIASHTEEITFYEELGLTPEASSEEIHDTFRALVRLLHPDQQTDPLLRDIAERQMRKLNRIYAILSDPERRRRYDETLAGDTFPPTIIVNASGNPNLRRLIGRVAWMGAILVSAGLLVWLASQNTPVPQTSSPGRTPASYDPASLSRQSSELFQPDSETERLRSSVKALTVERDAAIHELARIRGNFSSPPVTGTAVASELPNSTPTVALTELPSVAKLPPATPNPASALVEPVVNRRLAGFWFYTKPGRGQKNTNHALYLPEYIEATITEENGILRGKYRSRFQIVDRAISPDVNFSFSGVAAGAMVTCPSTGPGGARGEITFTLVANNSMRVDWTASELGNQQGLAAGTAVLTRRIE